MVGDALRRGVMAQAPAATVGRPKSSVAHHVKVLHEAGVLKVVRSRTIRGREEAFAFWDRVMDLVAGYDQLPRTTSGSRAYALLTAVYPTEHPHLPAPSTTTPESATDSEE